MKRSPRLVGVVPALNEAAAIGLVIEELRSFVETVVVVDDGSVDATARIADNAGAYVFRHETTRGLGAAFKTGIAEARSYGAELIVTIDGDGAHVARTVPNLVREHLICCADLTVGSRLLGCGDWFPSAKRSVNRLAAAIFRQLTGVALSDVASGMRVLGASAARLQVTADDYAYSFELLINATINKLRVVEVAVPVRYDACEPLVSRRTEILAFLRTFDSMEALEENRNALARIKEAVIAFEAISVAIGGGIYFLHPVAQYDSFLVQEQHPEFVSFDTKAAVCFR